MHLRINSFKCDGHKLQLQGVEKVIWTLSYAFLTLFYLATNLLPWTAKPMNCE